MKNQDSGWIAALLDAVDQQSLRSEVMADLTIELFNEAERKLTPIIGSRGMVKLYYANLSQVSLQYPWLSAAREDFEPSLGRMQLLGSLLTNQSADTAKLCGLSLLQGFYMRLVSLIGLAVTDTLLRPEWELSGAKYAQGL